MINLIANVNSKSGIALAIVGGGTAWVFSYVDPSFLPLTVINGLDFVVTEFEHKGNIIQLSVKGYIAVIGCLAAIVGAMKLLGIYSLIKKIVSGSGSLIARAWTHQARKREEKKIDKEMDDWLMKANIPDALIVHRGEGKYH